jgi:hypothetical protein
MGLVVFPGSMALNAQDCPYNIDFETGTFDGWTWFIGSAGEINGSEYHVAYYFRRTR